MFAEVAGGAASATAVQIRFALILHRVGARCRYAGTSLGVADQARAVIGDRAAFARVASGAFRSAAVDIGLVAVPELIRTAWPDAHALVRVASVGLTIARADAAVAKLALRARTTAVFIRLAAVLPAVVAGRCLAQALVARPARAVAVVVARFAVGAGIARTAAIYGTLGAIQHAILAARTLAHVALAVPALAVGGLDARLPSGARWAQATAINTRLFWPDRAVRARERGVRCARALEAVLGKRASNGE